MSYFLNQSFLFYKNLTFENYNNLNNSNFNEFKRIFLGNYYEKYIRQKESFNTFNFTLPFVTRYEKIIDGYRNLLYINKTESLKGLFDDFDDILDDFKKFKSEFLNEFYYFARITNGWGRV